MQGAILAFVIAGVITGAAERPLGQADTDPPEVISRRLDELIAAEDFEAALPCGRVLITRLQRDRRTDGFEMIGARSRLGWTLLQLHHYEEAETELQAAAALSETQAVANLEHADAYRRLALLHDARRQFDPAERLYEQALSVLDRLKDVDEQRAFVLADQAAHFLKRRRPEDATPRLQWALRLLRYDPGFVTKQQLRVLPVLADLSAMTGRTDEAETLRQQILDGHRFFRDPPVTVATAVAALAAARFAVNDVTGAERDYLRALDMFTRARGPRNVNTVDVRAELGGVYVELGDYVRALMELQFADEWYRQHSSPRFDVLANLAVTHAMLGRMPEADVLLEQARAAARQFGDDSLEMARVDLEAGIIHRDQADFARGETELVRALRVHERQPYSAAETNKTRLAIAHLYRATERVDESGAAYAQALNYFAIENGPYGPGVGLALHGLAMVHFARKQPVIALGAYGRYAEITERQVSRVLAGGSERQKREYLLSTRQETDETISIHLQYVPDHQYAAELALANILRRKGRVVDVAAAQLNRLRDNRAAQALMNGLLKARSHLSHLIYAGHDGRRGPDWRERIIQTWREAEESSSAVPFVSSLESNEELLTLPAVRSALPDGAALVEFVSYRPRKSMYRDNDLGEPRYAAYVLRRSGPVGWADLGDAETIDRLVHELRRIMNEYSSFGYKGPASALYTKVVEPLEGFLVGATTLIISPDKDLNLAPMAALLDHNGRHLVERFELTYASSGRDLVTLRNSAPSMGATVIVADPAFGGSDAGPYRRLRETAAEAKLIRKLSKSPRLVLTGAKATETRVKAISRPRILHIATHGFFFPATGGAVSPLPDDWAENSLSLSGLALAGANALESGPDDGVLTALELSDMELRGTQLVVLSACDTGIGTVPVGEGVFGLRRAIAMAGAETQVMSLWKVADRATRDVMAEYYRRLRGGEGRSAAFRAIQRRMINDGESPTDWAAFVVSGAGGPIVW